MLTRSHQRAILVLLSLALVWMGAPSTPVASQEPSPSPDDPIEETLEFPTSRVCVESSRTAERCVRGIQKVRVLVDPTVGAAVDVTPTGCGVAGLRVDLFLDGASAHVLVEVTRRGGKTRPVIDRTIAADLDPVREFVRVCAD